MSTMNLTPSTVLYIQGALMIGVGIYSLLDPDGFVAGTGDAITGRPSQIIHSIRYTLANIDNPYAGTTNGN